MAEHKSPLNGAVIPDNRFKPGDERAKEAGRKSGEKRREKAKIKKTFRETLETILSIECEGPTGETMDYQDAMNYAMVMLAAKGDKGAYALVRDTIGQKPVEKVEVHEVDYTALDAIRSELMK